MSYTTCRAALTEVLKGVQPRIPVILAYEPTQLQDFPTLYTLFASAERAADSPGIIAMRYRLIARLCFRWQDNEGAELETEPYINALPAVIDANAGLGGVLNSGLAKVPTIQGVFVSIGGTVYRALDFTVDILEKAPRSSGN